ncbi:hypothetical protein GCM10027047_16360 [Rhodococcus aerolatus]
MRPPPELDQSGYVRLVRRRLGMNQRELAAALGIAASTISRAEARRSRLDLATFTRVLRATGLRLVVVDAENRRVHPLREPPATRDLADRRFPAHLELVLDPAPGEWWGDCFGLVRPPETFHRDPAARLAHREVFHRLRGVLAHGEPVDWRTRVAEERERAQRLIDQRAARHPTGVVPYRRSRRRPATPATSVGPRARDRDHPARRTRGPAVDRAARPDRGVG